MARLAAALVAPAAGQLLALEVLAGGLLKKDAAQLWKATPSPTGLQYDAVGPQHSTTVKSTSTCVDSKSGVLYYVGGMNKSVEASEYVLYGLATETGESFRRPRIWSSWLRTRARTLGTRSRTSSA